MPVPTILNTPDIELDLALAPIKRDPCFYFRDAYFQVEDIVFKVPRHYFENDSEHFKVMFERAEVVRFPHELPGMNKLVRANLVLPLEDTGVEEFRHFLKALYPQHWGVSGSCTDIEPTEWVSILKLATRWGFEKIRAVAIHNIEGLLRSGAMSSFQVLYLARRCEVKRWLYVSLRMMCEEDLLSRDAQYQDTFDEEIGVDYARRLIKLQSHIQGLNQGIQYKRDKKDTKEIRLSENDFHSVIKKIFPEIEDA